MLKLEPLNDKNRKSVLAIERDDIPEDFVESTAYTINLSNYGNQLGLKGFCYAIKWDSNYVGLLLIGEAIPDDADPDELKGQSYFRVIGFVIDKRYRCMGIGKQALLLSIENVYNKYGRVPVLLQCHRDNSAALQFYEKAGFYNTNILYDDDWYMLKN